MDWRACAVNILPTVTGWITPIIMEPMTVPPPRTSPAVPLLKPLMEQLAIRLAHQKTMGKPLIIPQAGEEANEKGH